MTVTPVKKKRVWLSPDFVRSMLAGHSALGLAFAALIYVVCLTGTVAVFLHDLKRWEQPNAPIVVTAPSDDVIAAAVQTAYDKAKPKAEHPDIFVSWRGELVPYFSVSFDDHDSGVEGNWLANERGELVVEDHAPWSAFLGTLHVRLHIPGTWGLFLVGLTGVALLSSLISGVLAHPRIFRDAFAFRQGCAERLAQADLHNRLGVWGLPFHIAVSLTGAMLGLSVLVVGVLALAAYDGDSGRAFSEILGPRAGSDETSAPLADVKTMIEAVRSQHPDARFVSVRVEHAGTTGQIVHLGMSRPDHLSMANAYYFRGDGTSLGDGGLETGSIGQQTLGALQSLHFGWFGGYPIKVAYGVLGLALTIVTHTGFMIWMARRRDGGRPVCDWERLWPAIAWGQPFALAVTALVSLFLSEAPLLAIYCAMTVVTLMLGWFASTQVNVKHLLCVATSGVLSILVVAHVVVYGLTPPDLAALTVNVALLATAAILLLPTLKTFRTRRSEDASLPGRAATSEQDHS